ncbi:MAG: hypothetical protein U0T56_02760 [Ferruginibacter sp.]
MVEHKPSTRYGRIRPLVNQNRYSGYGTQLVSNISPLPSLFDAPVQASSLKTYNPAPRLDGVLNTTSTAISNKRGTWCLSGATGRLLPLMVRLYPQYSGKGYIVYHRRRSATHPQRYWLTNMKSSVTVCLGHRLFDDQNLNHPLHRWMMLYVWIPYGTDYGAMGLSDYFIIERI